MDRFYLPDKDLSQDELQITDQQIIHKVRDVLRMQSGDVLSFFCDGYEIEGQIIKLTSELLTVSNQGKIKRNTEPEQQINLYTALIPKNRFELILEKTTEIGVTQIIPIETERNVVDKISDNRKQRYERILKEATEQSNRQRVPILKSLTPFDEALKESFARNESTNLVFRPKVKSSEPPSIDTDIINIFIGPEGGFTREELEQMQEKSFKQISLGQRILRTETAAIIATGLAVYSYVY